MASYVPAEIRGKEALEEIVLGSRHDPEESVLFKFFLRDKTGGDFVETARRFARDETTGSWLGGPQPTATFLTAQADVERIEKYAPDAGVVYVRSPVGNMDIEEGPLYQLMMLAVGGPALEWVYAEAAWLDFELPPKLLKRFPGPKFGIAGLRKIIGLGEKDPIIGTIVKPCAGLTVEEVAQKCYEAALGGVTFIKDDEKMMGPPYCPFEQKVRTVSERLRAAQERIGRKVVYAPHLVCRADHMKEVAKRAIECGASGLMFNVVLGHTPEALMILAEDPDINVPLYAHSGGRSGLSTGPRRIDDVVIAKLIRYCGADFFQHGVFEQKECHVASLDDSLLQELATVLRQETEGIKDTVPVAAGGLGAVNLGANLEAHRHPTMGYAVAALAGSNILKHPEGPAAGARAMHQAARACMEEGIKGKEALTSWARKRGHSELLKIL